MNQTFQNSAQVFSIGIFFTLMIVGLASTLPTTLSAGLQAHGVDPATAHQVASAAADLDPVRRLPRLQPGRAPARRRTSSRRCPCTTRSSLTGSSVLPDADLRPVPPRPPRRVRVRDRRMPDRRGGLGDARREESADVSASAAPPGGSCSRPSAVRTLGPPRPSGSARRSGAAARRSRRALRLKRTVSVCRRSSRIRSVFDVPIRLPRCRSTARTVQPSAQATRSRSPRPHPLGLRRACSSAPLSADSPATSPCETRPAAARGEPSRPVTRISIEAVAVAPPGSVTVTVAVYVPGVR